ncbi:ZPBP2 protein, partial [Columbina picui]|nr:ZPBP2 protein [Columbina picui]
VAASHKEEKHSIDLIENNYVYGNTKHEVDVYVKMFANSPFLVCMDWARSREELIDPNYFWIGPDGKKLEGRFYVNLTETGKLMVMGFKEFMSGAYTCTLSHKIIETTTQEEREVFEEYKFMVYAYREADHAYQVFVRFTTKECNLAANRQFFEELRKILNNIIADLMCHVVESSYKCHSVKTPKQGLLYELFVSFQGNTFQCLIRSLIFMNNPRAKDRIGAFFQKQTYALRHNFHAVPIIHYVDNSFSVTHIDSCRPGFGKNNITHKNCASCCVVCEPGTYSPNNEVTCQICSRPQVQIYGATAC